MATKELAALRAALAKAKETLECAVRDDAWYVQEALATLDALAQLNSVQPVKKAHAVTDMQLLLSEAADDIEAWGAYASDYFQKKHDLAGCVAKYRDAAESLAQLDVSQAGEEGKESK